MRQPSLIKQNGSIHATIYVAGFPKVNVEEEADASVVQKLIRIVYGGKARLDSFDKLVRLYCLATMW